MIGDKVFTAMKSQSVEGDFHSNLHIGSSAEPMKLWPEERAVTVKAAKSLGLDIAGVNISHSLLLIA